MQIPAYSSVLSSGSVWGKSLACTCFAISSSWAVRLSPSSFSAAARRCASISRTKSSRPTSAKEFPSKSSKRVKIPPQSVVCGGWWKRTPRCCHSSNLPTTSSVTSTACRQRPISLYSSDLRLGVISARTVLPSGGATATQRPPAS